MLRKIQGILLRKIQISIKIVLQDTEKHLSTSRHDSYNIFCVSKLLDIQQQFYCLIVLLSYCLIVSVFRQSYCSIVCIVCIHNIFRRLQVSFTIVSHNTGTAFLTFRILQ